MKANRGFTLIELLIVITLLGILAVAVLSAINPVEQINRSRDTSSKSDAEQLINAVERYYSTKGYYPWMSGGNSENTAVYGAAETDAVEVSAADQTFGVDSVAALEQLSSGGTAEIKESYVSRIVAERARHLYIYNRGEQGDSTYVCFVPRSSSFREEAWSRCDTDAPAHADYGDVPSDFPANACPGTDCVGAGDSESATACMICLP